MGVKNKDVEARAVNDLEKALKAAEDRVRALEGEGADKDARIKAMEAANKLLEKDIKELTAKGENLTAALFEREGAGKNAMIERPEAAREMTGDEKKFVSKACKAYGIDEEHIFKARIDGDAAVVITAGGAKVTYRDGDEKDKGFKALEPVQVDGVIRKKMKPAMERIGHGA